MGYVDRRRGGRHQAVVNCPIGVLRLVLCGDVNEHFISIEFEAGAANRRLASLSELVNLSLSVQLLKGYAI